MKIVITGHTKGIGKACYDYFENVGHEVIGLSRSNGYDIKADIDKILDHVMTADLFINNAFDGLSSQIDLLIKASTITPNIVVMGSAVTDYEEVLGRKNIINKLELEETSRKIGIIDDERIANILLLKIAFAESTLSDHSPARIDSDYSITYKDIIDSIEFWLQHPKIHQIEYKVKLTEKTINEIKRITGSDKIETVLEEAKSIVF
jgi:hypothetical protein